MKKTIILTAIIIIASICAIVSMAAFAHTDSLTHGLVFVGAVAALMAAIVLFMKGEPYDYGFNATTEGDALLH